MKSTNTAIESRLDFIRSGNFSTSADLTPGDAAQGLSVATEPAASEQVGKGEPGPEALVEVKGPGGAPTLAPEYRPRTIAELGVRRAIVEELAVKTLYLGGTMSTRELAQQMRVSMNVADELMGRMRSGSALPGDGNDGEPADGGSDGSGEEGAGWSCLSLSQYAGAAPVSLESYVAQVRKQSVRNLVVRKADVERAFGDLIIDPKVLGQIGTGLNSGASIFVHGPAGVGKTAIAETMSRVLAEDDVWIPYAVEVDGQMIAVFDPMVHKQVDGWAPRDVRRALGAMPAAVGAGGRRADDRHAGPAVQYDDEVLQRAGADEGQQRSADPGRFRAAAGAAGRAAEPVGGAAGSRDRFSDDGRREEDRDSV